MNANTTTKVPSMTLSQRVRTNGSSSTFKELGEGIDRNPIVVGFTCGYERKNQLALRTEQKFDGVPALRITLPRVYAS
jgi:hypothetical protein